MRTQWKNSLTTTLGDEWSASRFDRLTSREGAHGTGWLACSVELMAGLDTLDEKNPSPLAGIELWILGSPTLSAVTEECHAVSAAIYRSISYVICISASHALGIL
jgi:hypothetical protein